MSESRSATFAKNSTNTFKRVCAAAKWLRGSNIGRVGGSDFRWGLPHSGVCTQLSNNILKVTLRCGYWQRAAAGGNVDQPTYSETQP